MSITFTGTFTGVGSRSAVVTPSLSVSGSTQTLHISRSSGSRSHSATQTATKSDSASSSMPPEGNCTAETWMSPIGFTTMLYDNMIACPDTYKGRSFLHFSSGAIPFSDDGALVTLRLTSGVFFTTIPPSSMVRIFAKSAPLFECIGSADDALSTTDYDSGEKHGLMRNVEKGNTELKYTVTPRTFTLGIYPRGYYRITDDEWIYVLFYRNATVGAGCAAQKPIVVHVSPFRHGALNSVSDALSFVVLVIGVLAAVCGTSVPTSHHAGMVAMLAQFAFAQEDGNQLPITLHPLQTSIGTTKYQYIMGTVLGSSALLAVIGVVQLVLVAYFHWMHRYHWTEATHKVYFPRIWTAVAMHLSVGLFYGGSRNLGNSTMGAFVLSTAVLFCILLCLCLVHRVTFSSTLRFEAEFLWHEVAAFDPLRPNRLTYLPPKHHLTSLGILPSMMTSIRGRWRSTDADRSFVDRLGFVFESYVPDGKLWMGLEVVDFFLCSVVTCFDNYMPLMALYQYIITMIVKLAMILMLIAWNPFVCRHSGMACFAVYCLEALMCLALSISTQSLALMQTCSAIQELLGLAATIVLLVNCGIVMARSLAQCRDDLSRDRRFVITDATELVVPLNEGALIFPLPDRSQPDPREQLQPENATQRTETAKRAVENTGATTRGATEDPPPQEGEATRDDDDARENCTETVVSPKLPGAAEPQDGVDIDALLAGGIPLPCDRETAAAMLAMDERCVAPLEEAPARLTGEAFLLALREQQIFDKNVVMSVKSAGRLPVWHRISEQTRAVKPVAPLTFADFEAV